MSSAKQNLLILHKVILFIFGILLIIYSILNIKIIPNRALYDGNCNTVDNQIISGKTICSTYIPPPEGDDMTPENIEIWMSKVNSARKPAMNHSFVMMVLCMTCGIYITLYILIQILQNNKKISQLFRNV